MNMLAISGIHHITAISSDPRKTVDFYTQVLGLRMIKLTVNYDDPGTYHLYFADKTGAPGTVLTFFPWLYASRGRQGTGLTAATAYSVPPGAMNYWIDRFAAMAVNFDTPISRFGEDVLGFEDPDGMKLELIAHPSIEVFHPWEKSIVPAEYQVRGFYGVTLQEKQVEPSAELLLKYYGYRKIEEHSNRFRYAAAGTAHGRVVDILHTPNESDGRMGAGSVHHVAFRVPNDAKQNELHEQLLAFGLHVSQQYERNYFHSIYFREPGGVIFEIATDGPGFTIDEPLDKLGTTLALPPWMEPRRAEIEQALPKPYPFPKQ
jgi:glyoxalase family protein